MNNDENATLAARRADLRVMLDEGIDHFEGIDKDDALRELLGLLDNQRDVHVDDVWGEHPEFPRSDWRYEVGNGDTNQGYWEWCAHQAEDDEHPANQ